MEPSLILLTWRMEQHIMVSSSKSLWRAGQLREGKQKILKIDVDSNGVELFMTMKF